VGRPKKTMNLKNLYAMNELKHNIHATITPIEVSEHTLILDNSFR
jgi:hypothetical protein